MFADLCDRDGDDFSSWRTFAHRCHRHTCLPLQKTNQGDTNVSDDELDDDDGDKSDDDGDVVGWPKQLVPPLKSLPKSQQLSDDHDYDVENDIKHD